MLLFPAPGFAQQFPANWFVADTDLAQVLKLVRMRHEVTVQP